MLLYLLQWPFTAHRQRVYTLQVNSGVSEKRERDMAAFLGQFIALESSNVLKETTLQDWLTMVVSEHLQKFLVVSVDVFCSFGAFKVVTECRIFIHTIKRKPQRHHVERSENPIFKVIVTDLGFVRERSANRKDGGGSLLFWPIFPKKMP